MLMRKIPVPPITTITVEDNDGSSVEKGPDLDKSRQHTYTLVDTSCEVVSYRLRSRQL